MSSSALKLEILETLAQVEFWRERNKGSKVGLVPTMGALHSGHMTLVEAARNSCDVIVVSIFVNPLQFGPNEDFGKYPRALENDLRLCEEAGVSAVFHPAVEVMYPNGQDGITKIHPPSELIAGLCGAFRPGHFVGVATVVNNLFNIIRPDVSFFGEKDYQQLQVIKHMVHDLNMQLKVVGVPTVREKDGLALSSRNVYLSSEQRRLAPKIYEAMSNARESILQGTSISESLFAARGILGSLPGVSVQYFECCDPLTLRPVSDPKAPSIVLVAAKYGDVRLIDNLIVRPTETR